MTASFAVGMIVGAPAMAVLTLRMPRRNGRIWLAFGTTALYQASVVGLVSYIAPLLTEVTGLDAVWVSSPS